MNVLSWLGSLFTGSHRRPSVRRKLEVEALEQRCLLAAVSPAAIAQPVLGVNDYWNLRELSNWWWSRQGHTNIVFLGDSITEAYASPYYGGPIWLTHIAPLGAVNFGVNGFTTSQVLTEIQSGEVASLTPNVVVLNIGTNNLGTALHTPWDVQAGVREIISELQAQLPHTAIVLTGLLPRGQSGYDSWRILIPYTNLLLSQLADSVRVRFVDVGNYFLLPNGNIWDPLTTDYVHPSTLGFGFYTEGLAPVLKQALADNAAGLIQPPVSDPAGFSQVLYNDLHQVPVR